MSEKRLWDYIRGGIGHAGHFDRIESTFTVAGRPDVNYCIDGCEGDFELKIYDKRKGGFVLRSGQVAWHAKRVQAKGRCFIIARYDGPKKLFLLIHSKNAKHLAHDRSFEGWLAQSALVWEGSINWSKLKATLKGVKDE